MRKLKYSFEYFCSPFWLEEETSNNPIYENIDIFLFPVNNYLLKEISRLDKIYQSSYNDNYPPEPLEYDLIQNLIFTHSVIVSYQLLKKEVGKRYDLIFEINYWENRLYRLKEEFNKKL